MTLERGAMLNNRYRIDGLLGQGGRGAVYLAWDANLRIAVAIKENLDASREAQEQFFYEANVLARLSHPNLTRVTDYFFIPGQGQYLVMDYVQGEDLEKMVEQHGPMSEADALKWTTQVCRALSYLHGQNPPIIHRDIKPANIKIRPDGQAMLVDFGIAKSYDPRSGTLLGAKAITPGYSPPEQYGFGTTDPRSDIYALGATLYHLLTGRALPESVQRAAGATTTPLPRQLNPQISPGTEKAIIKAVEVLSDRRFQNIGEFQSAIQAQTIKLTDRYSDGFQSAPFSASASTAASAVTPPALKKATRKSTRWWVLGGVLGVLAIAVVLGAIYLINQGKEPGAGQKSFLTAACNPPCYTLNNHLASRVEVWIDGESKGTLEPGATKQFWHSSSPVRLRWVAMPLTNQSGQPIGSALENVIPQVENGATLEVTNKIGEQLFFAPLLTNNLDRPCEISVDDGYAGEQRPGVLNPGARNVLVGYHPLFKNSNVKLYCGDKVYFWGLPADAPAGAKNPLLKYVQPQSGLVSLSVP
jgi:serine/threonine protein kinase